MRLIPLRAGYTVTGLRSFGIGTAPSLASAFVGVVLPADVIYIFACSSQSSIDSHCSRGHRVSYGVHDLLLARCMLRAAALLSLMMSDNAKSDTQPNMKFQGTC